MTDLMTCPSCGALDQEVGKFCEQCGTRLVLPDAAPATPADAAPVDAAPTMPPDAASADAVPPTPPDAAPADATPPPDAGAADPAAASPDPRPGGASMIPAPDDRPTRISPQPDAPVSTSPGAGAAMGEPSGTGALNQATVPLRFIRLQNGVFNREHAFDVPVGTTLLLGRTDPSNGVFPDVDLTLWSARVSTPEGALYTVHRKQCIINRDDAGRVWIRDYPDYLGDTMVSPVGSAQFQPIPTLGTQRTTDSEGAVALEVGDRVLMGQGEGMLIFTLMQV